MMSPFGVKANTKQQWANFTNYYIDCQITQSMSQTSVAFRDFLEKLDNKIVELVKEHPQIFGSGNEYSSMLRHCHRSNLVWIYPKLFKMQLPRDSNGNFTSVLFDETKNKIKLKEDNIEELLCKRKVFKCIIECSKLWSFNEKVGSIWNIVQLKFSEQSQKEPEELESNENSSTNVYSSLMILDD
jgi:predicted esterase YcpF (UPF0227 family)